MESFITISEDTQRIDELIASGTHIDTLDDFYGFSLLHYAASHKRMDIVKYLLNHGADVNVRGKEGHTPLMCALNGDSCDIAIYLVESGADINMASNHGHTALHYVALCCKEGAKIPTLKYFLDRGADKEHICNGVPVYQYVAEVYRNDEAAEFIKSYELIPTKGVY